ncbi:MAG: AI-2E family transporter [Bacilli bacterium]|nr:AI-2E family transporter [Bacilli bacterium]
MFGKKVDVKKINEVADLSSKVLRILYFLLLAALCYFVIIIFKETQVFSFIKTIFKVVFPLFIGLLIAWLFDPFVKWLEGKGVKRIIGAAITYFIIFIVLYLVLSSLIPLLIDQVKEIIKMSPYIFDKMKEWASDFFVQIENNSSLDVSKLKGEIFSSINDFASRLTTTMPSNFLGFVSRMFSFFGTFILGLIIGFFLIVNFDSSSKLIYLIPKRYRDTTSSIMDEVNGSLRNYVKGAVIDSLLIFILSSLGLWICGLKAPLLFGLFCGLTNIIPYAGPYIGGVPAVIVGLTQSPMTGIFCLIVIAVIQFLEGNFLQPLIMAKTTKLHPVTILLGLLVFGHFFGIIGMLISTPLIAVFKTVFKYYNDRYEFLKKEDSHEE